VTVALAYQKAFAAVLLLAFWSLGRQVPSLVGERGLLPAHTMFERLGEAGVSFWRAPSLFWLDASDAALQAGTWLGMLLALLALLGRAPRACFALSAPLYLSYAVACDDFTAFQWDNMLVEVALLSALLPTDRPEPLVRWSLRLLIFKLYFESGIAKWQSHLHDWHDGSAMTFYYQTAPLPGPLGWHAHHLPERWHHLESWGALALELLVPFLVLGGRRMRLVAFASLTGFQIVNTLTANYGFFTYLSTALHVLLLEDRDIARAWAFVTRKPLAALPALAPPKPPFRGPGEIATAIALAAWLLASVASGVASFTRSESLDALLAPIARTAGTWRVANVYRLFGHITRERIEPQVELLGASGEWTEHDLRYKAGDVMRAPSFVAPHQPRVAFRLWFYGLDFRRGMPEYVHNLLDRLCRDRPAVQALFEQPLPAEAQASRIAFFSYRFTTPEERRKTGAYWVRERLGALQPRSCS
jgi:uncharacterized membrane protein YphA (DoxX/SURF4 family)